MAGLVLVELEAQRTRAFERVGTDERTRIVLHPVDAVGVCGQGVDGGMALQALDQAQAELAGASSAAGLGALAARSDGDGGLAAREDDARPRKGLAAQRDGTCEGGMDFADFTRLAFDLVAQDMDREAGLARQGGCGFERFLRRCLLYTSPSPRDS